MQYEPRQVEKWRSADLEHDRRMTFQQKLDATMSLFYVGCDFMRSGLRSQFPDATEEEIERILRNRIAKGKRSHAA